MNEEKKVALIIAGIIIILISLILLAFVESMPKQAPAIQSFIMEIS